MKKRSLFPEISGSRVGKVFKLLFLLLPLVLFSVPIGNPYSPAVLEQGFFIRDTFWCQPRVSFSEDWMFDQELLGKGLHRPALQGTSQIFSFTWSIAERFDVSLSAGTGQNQYRWSSNLGAIEGRSSGGVVWYGEGKIILLEILDSGLSLFGEAGGWDWMDGPVSINGEPLLRDSSLKMRFWRVGGAISQKIGPLVPYAGAFICRSNWKFQASPLSTNYLHQRQPIGAVVGCSFCRGKGVSLNIEWRGWSENAATLSGEIRW